MTIKSLAMFVEKKNEFYRYVIEDFEVDVTNGMISIDDDKNVLAFVPIGLLFGIAFKHMTWWKVALIGCCISVSIEGLQFWLMKGFSELDDVMHNTMGCILEYMVFLFVAKHGKRGIELKEVHN